MTIANGEKWIDKETKGLSEAAMDIDLTLSADTIRLLAQKARAVASSLQDTFEDGHEGDVEFDADALEQSHGHDGLAEEENDDLSDEELRELIEDLNVDEAAELVAISWIGAVTSRLRTSSKRSTRHAIAPPVRQQPIFSACRSWPITWKPVSTRLTSDSRHSAVFGRASRRSAGQAD